MLEEKVVAHSDVGCMLFALNTSTNKYEYLVPVRTIPATGGSPSQIEVTEMDSPIKQFILDRQDTPAYEFDYNYTKSNYAVCKAKFDGKTENKFLITYSDKSGVKFSGIGATWRDSLNTGEEIKGKISVAVSSVDDVEDCSSIIDISTIPSGKTHPFATTSSVVKFDLNGGTGTSIADITVVKGNYITIPQCNAVVDTDEDFNCWNTKADGSGDNLAVGQKYFPTEDITLYAKYSESV